MLQMTILLCFTFLWAKIQPELLYGIIQGYTRDELKIIKDLSLRNTIFYFGFESSLMFIIFYLAKGLIFAIVLNKWLLAELWQQWLGLSIIIALITVPKVSSNEIFWKRWAVYMGGAVHLFPELAQLSLALLIALSLFTLCKKYIIWSSTIAGVILLWLPIYPYPIMGLVLITCLITSFGITPNLLNTMVNNTIQIIVSPKRSFDQYNTLK